MILHKKKLDTTDAFIDLIIIWENLFGTRNGEVAFRISLSISKLLHKNPVDRLETFNQVKDLYDKRSEIVHGSQHYNPQQIQELYDSALKITVEVLKNIFQDNPELLNYSSDKRSRLLAIKN
jgi:Ethanolamine utilization protein EutJ (predicted chaperonin)